MNTDLSGTRDTEGRTIIDARWYRDTDGRTIPGWTSRAANNRVVVRDLLQPQMQERKGLPTTHDQLPGSMDYLATWDF